MESIVIGTAGHIDHGKTTLVKALTGRDTDTLEEEQRRGITINLGFAYFTLPNGKTAGIVDVPGHERFIKNMLAGASGIDIAIIVVAANEGIMPQTREHIDILSYMDIQYSVIVLTKIDMVDEELREMAEEEIREYAEGTFLENTPIFAVDSLSKKGIDDLITHLDSLSEGIEKRETEKSARMSIDRIFGIKGFGTVVTGTLSEGTVTVGEDVIVYPEGLKTKIRNLQIHENDVESAHAGQRTAMNLAKIEVGQISRGSVVAVENSVYVTEIMDVYISVSRNAQAKIKRMEEVKVYLGAKELVARVLPLEQRNMEAGEAGYAQILLQQQAVVRKGDAFVLRSISPVETIGGGRVVDPAAQRRRKVNAADLERIAQKDRGTPQAMLEAFVYDHPFQNIEVLQGLSNGVWTQEDMETLLETGRVIALGDLYIHRETAEGLGQALLGVLQKYHENYPLREGVPKAELLSQQKVISNDKDLELLLRWLCAERKIKEAGKEAFAVPDFTPKLSPGQQKVRQELEEKIDSAGYNLFTLSELTENRKDKKQIMEMLLQDSLMLLEGQFVILRKLYQKAREIVITLAEERGVVKLADLRDALDTSRKYTLLLLERFDNENLTQRQGEDRVLVQKTQRKA